MNAIFNKISIDFEYLNEIYTIKSDPYKTLSELKELVSKKIFPFPGDVHCFYKNLDLIEQEDDEISKIFPNKTKIKITLKKPQKDKPIKKQSISRNSLIKIVAFDTEPKSQLKESRPQSKVIRKSKMESDIKLPKIDNIRMKGRQSCFLYGIKKLENNLNKNSQNNINDDLNNDMIKQNEIGSYQKLMDLDDNETEAKSLIDKYKGNKMDYLLTDKKDMKSLNFLLSSLKPKNNNQSAKKYKLGNSFSLPKSLFKNNKEIINHILNTEIEHEIKKINMSIEKTEAKTDNKNIDKNNLDENYLCNSCKKNIISQYCLNCNGFKCNSCIDLCKTYTHEILQINLNLDCYKIIMSYYDLVNSNINSTIEEILQNNKELKIYNIKKSRDELVSFINDLLNIYNEIINILENEIYKENNIKKEMNKYENETNKIKAEINEIMQKANSFLKNEENINKPKFKMMNVKHFFNLLNEKRINFNSLTQNMKVYTLNNEINSNLEKSFNDMKNIMQSMTNLDNPFSLSKDLNAEYLKLNEKFNNTQKERKKMMLFRRRNSISTNGVIFPNFPLFGADKAPDINI